MQILSRKNRAGRTRIAAVCLPGLARLASDPGQKGIAFSTIISSYDGADFS